MKLKNIFKKKNSGFTIIEILVVIVIIATLAGVLVMVVDPGKQRNKAKDANTKAALTKMSVIISGYVSAKNQIPDEDKLLELVVGSEHVGSCDDGNAWCVFKIEGVDLPVGGSVGNYYGCAGSHKGVSASQCNFLYCGGDYWDTPRLVDGEYVGDDLPGYYTTCAHPTTTTEYRIFAKSWTFKRMFMYRSLDSRLYLCDDQGNACEPI